MSYLLAILTHTHTHPFNGPFPRLPGISQYQKGKTNLDFTVARDSEWQWHQLGHMQACTSLQTDNHASTPPFFYRPDALLAAQPTSSKHWRLYLLWRKMLSMKRERTVITQMLCLCFVVHIFIQRHLKTTCSADHSSSDDCSSSDFIWCLSSSQFTETERWAFSC